VKKPVVPDIDESMDAIEPITIEAPAQSDVSNVEKPQEQIAATPQVFKTPSTPSPEKFTEQAQEKAAEVDGAAPIASQKMTFMPAKPKADDVPVVKEKPVPVIFSNKEKPQD